MRHRALATALMFACLGLAPAPAAAAQLIAVGVHHVRLIVDHHVARVSYTDRHGRRRHVLAWHALNARTPSRRHPQVQFRVDYSGGSGSFGPGFWRRMHDHCGRYTGPPLRMLVAACTAGDGTSWALQRWKRRLRNGGWPTSGTRSRYELSLSHWIGKLPRLRVYRDWSYGGRFDHLFGTLRYRRHGVYGFRYTRRGVPRDGYGRNVFVDTHDPPWGRGWFRFNGAVTHPPKGVFCFSMFALFGRTTPAKGDRYRVTVSGPGVTPVLRWVRPAPGPYDAARDAVMNAKQRRLAPRPGACHNPS